jgi:hypothetical protein
MTTIGNHPTVIKVMDNVVRFFTNPVVLRVFSIILGLCVIGEVIAFILFYCWINYSKLAYSRSFEGTLIRVHLPNDENRK